MHSPQNNTDLEVIDLAFILHKASLIKNDPPDNTTVTATDVKEARWVCDISATAFFDTC